MEDIVQIRIVFVAGLLVMSGVMAVLALAAVRLEEWLGARAGRARSRQTAKNIPMRGTR